MIKKDFYGFYYASENGNTYGFNEMVSCGGRQALNQSTIVLYDYSNDKIICWFRGTANDIENNLDFIKSAVKEYEEKLQ